MTTKVWKVKLLFQGQEVPLPGEWKTRDDAEWDIAKWKQRIGLYTDPFIYYEEEREEKKE